MMKRLFVGKKVIIKNKTEWKNAMRNVMTIKQMGYDNSRSDSHLTSFVVNQLAIIDDISEFEKNISREYN